MRTTKTEIVKVAKVTITDTCDNCGKSTIDNHGRCGWRLIMECSFCNDDCCSDCRKFFSEDPYSDYPHGVISCLKCLPKAQEAWDWAVENAGRYDNIEEVTMKRYKEISVDNP